MRLAVIEPLPFGGLLHYATQLADALAERGDDVDLIVARDNELAGRPGAARRVAVLPPDAPPAPPHPSRAQVTLRRARTAARIAATWRQIVRAVRKGRYDAVLLNGSFDMPLTCLCGLTLTHLNGRTPVAHVVHNVRPFNRWGGEGLYIDSGSTVALLRRLYPSFDLLFVHGEASRKEFEATWGPARLAIVPHGDEGIFAAESPPPASEPRILFFGAWRKMKGLPVLMEAFDALAARRPEVRLTLAGPDVPEEGESARVLEWAARQGDRVEALPGYVPVEDVEPLFARARVVVLPYLAGYQSGVVHLAMTMGRAVVATDVGDLPSAVADGETGLVVPSRDAAALASALERVLDDAQLAQRLGTAGRARMMNGSGWPAVAEQVQAGLRTLVEGAR
jgi:glycosyltransferase involved in cell wall biosynthesis